MASLDLQRLWKLHKVDSGLVDIRHQAAALDPGKSVRIEIERLKAQDSEVGGRYRYLHRELTDIELENKGAMEKIKGIEKQLYGGTIVSPREASAFEQEIAIIKKHIGEREERQLELYDLIGPAKEAHDKLQAQIEEKKKELGEANKKGLALKAELQREFARLTKLRPEAAKVVNPTLLARYEDIRKRHGGIGMAEVTKKGMCGACGTNLPERTLQMLREDKVATCEACHRILYFTDGVV
jgi:predicted  nucleic acid-binding Zn-ribbon protein